MKNLLNLIKKDEANLKRMGEEKILAGRPEMAKWLADDTWRDSFYTNNPVRAAALKRAANYIYDLLKEVKNEKN